MGSLERVRDELVEDAVQKMLKSDEEYEAQATPLMTAKQLKERDEKEIRQRLDASEQREAIARGFQLIRQDIVEVLNEEQLDPFFDDLAKVNKETLERVPEKVKSLMETGDEAITFQELFELDNETIKSMYTLGYQYFEKKFYKDARDVFTVVTTFNPYVADFWNATALCYQAMQEFEKAVQAFSVACSINTEGVVARVSRAECCIQLNRLGEAGEDLQMAERIVEENPALDAEWGQYLKSLRENL